MGERASCSRALVYLIGLGFLPVWLAAAYVVSAYMESGTDAAPAFYVFMIAIPSCVVTLSIAGIAIAMESRNAGSEARKRPMSTGFLAAALLALICLGIAFRMSVLKKERSLGAEEVQVVEFVKQNAEVRAAVGEPLAVSIAAKTIEQSGAMPSLYDVSAAGSKRVFAIVEADRRTKPVTFRLICITPLSLVQREAFKDPCAPADSPQEGPPPPQTPP